VPQDMAQRTMEHLVRRIHAINYLYFTKKELNARGMGHNKPLYITVRCKDCTIDKVLVDNGSTLNVLPKHVLDEMLVDSTHMLPSTMTTRAYDGSLWQVVGTIEIGLFIGPEVFLVTLLVIDIHSSYNMFVGRPWIHATSAMTSSLHKCLMYILNGILVKVMAEEALTMVQNMVVLYKEVEGRKYRILYVLKLLIKNGCQKTR